MQNFLSLLNCNIPVFFFLKLDEGLGSIPLTNWFPSSTYLPDDGCAAALEVPSSTSETQISKKLDEMKNLRDSWVNDKEEVCISWFRGFFLLRIEIGINHQIQMNRRGSTLLWYLLNKLDGECIKFIILKSCFHTCIYILNL